MTYNSAADNLPLKPRATSPKAAGHKPTCYLPNYTSCNTSVIHVTPHKATKQAHNTPSHTGLTGFTFGATTHVHNILTNHTPSDAPCTSNT